MTRPPSSYGRVLAIVGLSTFLSMLAYSGPLGNAVTLSAALGTSEIGSTWILASMSIGLAVTLLVVGIMADRFGQRRIFIAGAVVFALMNLMCAVSGSAALFVVARILAGVGAAGMVATGLGLVATVTAHHEQRARTSIWWSISMGAGIALGPVLTGLGDLVENWSGFYFLLSALGLVVALMSRALPAKTRMTGPSEEGAGTAVTSDGGTRPAPRRIDILGTVLLTAFLATGVTAIVQIRAGGGIWVIILFAVSMLLLVLFVLSQTRRTTTLIDTRLLRSGDFRAATVAALGTGISVIAVMSYACTFFVNGIGMTTIAAAGLLTLWSAGSSVAALLGSRVLLKITGSAQLLIGLVGTAIGLALLTGTGTESGPWHFVPGLIMLGISSGVLNSGLARQSVASVPADHAAMGTGANNTARYIGSSIGVSIAGVLAVSMSTYVQGWNTVAWAGAGAALVCAVLVVVFSRQRTG